MAKDHAFGVLSEFCVRCGAARADVVDGRRSVTCHATANVIAVSERLASRPLRRLARNVVGGR